MHYFSFYSFISPLSFQGFQQKLALLFFQPYSFYFCCRRNPSSLSHCPELRVVSLSFNQLTGGIPQAIGSLSNLEELYLGYKKFSGLIPSEIGNLVQLQILSLSNNSLTGALFFFLFFNFFPLKLSRISTKASLIIFPTLFIYFCCRRNPLQFIALPRAPSNIIIVQSTHWWHSTSHWAFI